MMGTAAVTTSVTVQIAPTDAKPFLNPGHQRRLNPSFSDLMS